ncbi:LemA family protein [uncultured archaeon]|nr:LemA family protein [uncultured archaeon]
MNTIIWVAIIAMALVLVFWRIIKWYNELTYWQTVVDEMWGRIEIVLRKKYDLIPAIVEAVKGYATHEKGAFVEVAEARSQWSKANTTTEKVKAANRIEENFIKLQTVVERYPKLRADRQFSQLMKRLTYTEADLRQQRMSYNNVVKRYNVRTKLFPIGVVAKIFGFTEKPFFTKEM